MQNRGQTKNCDLCLMENIKDYEEAYTKKYKTKEQIVHELGITNYKWYKHMREHVVGTSLVIASEIAPDLAKQLVDVVGHSAGICDRIAEKIEEMYPDINASSDPQLINTWIKMESELGRMLERIERISGNVGATTHIENQQVNIEYTNVVGQVMQDACPLCKEKFVKSLAPYILKNTTKKE